MASPKHNLIQNNLKKDLSTQKPVSKKRRLDETQIFKENNIVEAAAPVVKKVKINNGSSINYIERNKQMIAKQTTTFGFTGAIKSLVSTATKKLGIPSNFGFGSYFKPQFFEGKENGNPLNQIKSTHTKEFDGSATTAGKNMI